MNALAEQSAPLIKKQANPQRSRLALFDFARLLAIYSIVWLHTPRSPQLMSWTVLGRFAVPFFAAGAMFFVIDGLRRHPQRALREYAGSRFRRIYVPFLAWSGIYLVFKLIKAALLPDQPNDYPGIEALWTGTFFHLWFMPFVLLATLGVFVIGRFVVDSANRQWPACAALLMAGLAIAVFDPPRWIAADSGFALLAWDALPAVCWGFALALAYPHGFKLAVESRLVTTAFAAAFVGLMAWLAAFGRNTLIENLAGIVFLLIALQPISLAWINRVGRFGSLAYGIYLAHMLVIKVLESVATKFHAPISWQLDVAIFVTAAAGSTALAWVLTRSPRTCWLAA